MSAVSGGFASRAKTVGQMLLLPPLFLFVTLIPWLIAFHAGTLSRWLHGKGWDLLGAASRTFAIGVAIVTAIVTVWFLVVWFVMLVRIALGRETLDET